jgi:hypothetical protein
LAKANSIATIIPDEQCSLFRQPNVCNSKTPIIQPELANYDSLGQLRNDVFHWLNLIYKHSRLAIEDYCP